MTSVRNVVALLFNVKIPRHWPYRVIAKVAYKTQVFVNISIIQVNIIARGIQVLRIEVATQTTSDAASCCYTRPRGLNEEGRTLENLGPA